MKLPRFNWIEGEGSAQLVLENEANKPPIILATDGFVTVVLPL